MKNIKSNITKKFSSSLLVFLSLFSLSCLNTAYATQTTEKSHTAQDEKKILGLYRLGSTDPVDPGSQLLLTEDKHFALATFVGIYSGTWSINDGILTLTQSSRKLIYLYGRHRKSLGDKTRIRFNGDKLEELLVNFNPHDESQRHRVFDSGGNCFSPPHVYELDHHINHLELVDGRTNFDSPDSELKAFKFDLFKNYNDFLVYFLDTEASIKTLGQFRVVEGGLQAYRGNGAEPRRNRKTLPLSQPLDDISPERLRKIREEIEYKAFPQELKSDHRYFPYLNADEERNPEEVASYHLIEETSVVDGNFDINNMPEKHLLTARCPKEYLQ